MGSEASGSGGGLKLEPHMIPTLRQAFQSALEQLSSASPGDLKIAQPAMADQASMDFQAAFNKAADEAGQQLTDYRARLQRVVQQLDAIQQAYDRHEYDTAAELAGQLEP